MENILFQVAKVAGEAPVFARNKNQNYIFGGLIAAFNVAVNAGLFALILTNGRNGALSFALYFARLVMQVILSYNVVFNYDTNRQYLSLKWHLDKKLRQESETTKNSNRILNAVIIVSVACAIARECLIRSPQNGVLNFLLTTYSSVSLALGYLQRLVVIERIKEHFIHLNRGIREKEWNIERINENLARHEDLTRLIDFYNSLFGLWTFFYIVWWILLILTILFYNLTQGLQADRAIWFLSLPTIQLIVQMLLCKQIESLGEETTQLVSSEADKYAGVLSLTGKIFWFVQQTTVRCPKFTAAGFFVINNALMFACFNILVTYVIALLQFTDI